MQRRIFIFLAAMAALCGGLYGNVHAEGVGPLHIAKQGYFFVGGKYVETASGPVMTGQAFVEYQIPETARIPIPS